MNTIRKYFPSVILGGIFLVIFLANFSSRSFLIGWDNLLPEINPWLNLKRSIFSVWQENQGLGTLAGNGHAAEIPHQLIIFLFSFLPIHLIRQAYIFSMLLLGPLGTYFLIRRLVLYKNAICNQLIPLFGSLFYLLNLSTVQTFYVPFEPFIVHFAAFPWLLLCVLNFAAKNNKKSLIFFLIINILAIPQGQVPTVFFVYFLAISLFLIVLVIETRRIEILKRSIAVILLTCLVNAFWLLPFAYFVFNNSHVAFDSKINQIATDTVFLQNKEFGNIWDTMILKGFWFNNIDLSLKDTFGYMFSPWRERTTGLISVIGYLFFGIILLGFISVKRKAPFVLPFSALFLLSFTMLTTNTPPFSWIDELLRRVPLLNQVFRFPFTKFSILASLTYSFFFSLGVGKLIDFLQKFEFRKIATYILCSLIFISLFVFIYPVFNGNLFYKKEKVAIPKEYFQLFDYLKHQDKNIRIANFPQPSFWGWNFYKWGYGGSGFLWHGVEQPILDRAFDVWGESNENYYWEISNALYSKNASLFEAVLNKYQISLLLFDENIVNPTSPKALFKNEFEELIAQIPSIQKAQAFDNITLYKVALKNQTNKFIFLSSSLPIVNEYNWGNDDKAFQTIGNYTSADKNFNIFYPFRSLFSGKNEENKEFKINTDERSIEFFQTLPENTTQISVDNKEKFVSAEFSVIKNADQSLTISANIETPQIYIQSGNEKIKIWGQSVKKDLFVVNNPVSTLSLNINGSITFIADPNNPGLIGSTLLMKNGDNILTLNNNDKPVGIQTITNNDVLSLIEESSDIPLDNLRKNSKIFVGVPKIQDENQGFRLIPSNDWINQVKDCESFKKGKASSTFLNTNNKKAIELYSENTTACTSYYFPSLEHDQGYITLIENKNKKGRPLHFWVLNEDGKYSVIDTYLNPNKNLILSPFVVPPQEKFGKGYSLHLDNTSIGTQQTINDLGEVSIYPIPYELLTTIVASNKQISSSETNKPASVNHPNPAYYDISLGQNRPQRLIISQSFDKGWKAYEVKSSKLKVQSWLNSAFPFLFGKELKEHVLVNNWENGWVIPDSSLILNHSSLIIIYWPQYLEYIGFLILILIFLTLFLEDLIRMAAKPFLGKGFIDRHLPFLIGLFEFVYMRIQKDKFKEFTIPLNAKLKVSTKDPAVGLYLLLNETYEPKQTELFINSIKPGDVVVDVGANIGYYTVLASKKTGINGKVFAFEPNVENFKLLSENVSLNKGSNVVAAQKAVSDRNQKITFYSKDLNKAESSLSSNRNTSSYEIQAVSFDSYFMTDQRIDVVKMDIEGAEIMALKGAKKTFSQKNIKLFIEYNPSCIKQFDKDPKRLLQLIEELGFRIISIINEADNTAIPYSKENLEDTLKKTTYCNLFCSKT